MKAFDLEKALAGEPVLLLNNNPPLKAYLSRSKLRDDGIIFEFENENRTVLRHSEKWLEGFGTNIVMWEENNDEGEFKMKPFNLEQALAGEPVKLRDGSKAYVKYVLPDEYKGNYPLRGFYKYRNEYIQRTWMKDGKYSSEHKTSNEDIIGMWEEPRPTVTLTLPCPLNEPQEGMWFIEDINSENPIGKSEYTRNNHVHWMKINHCYLYSGVYFSSKEDAQAWLDALKNSRR